MALNKEHWLYKVKKPEEQNTLGEMESVEISQSNSMLLLRKLDQISRKLDLASFGTPH